MIRTIKKPVTLLEVLIAMALTVIILMTLIFFYRQVVVIGIEVDKVMSENFSRRYVESRLADVLPKAVSETDPAKDFVFLSIGDEGLVKPGSQSLIFTFDNRVSLDKDLANHVLGRIYLSKEGSLVLACWPSPKRWDSATLPSLKKEILMEGVDNLTFEFYVAPEKAKKEIPTQEQGKKDPAGTPEKDQQQTLEPKGEWRKLPWMTEFNQLPAMIKVIVNIPKEKKPIVFAFPITNAKEHIIYD